MRVDRAISTGSRFVEPESRPAPGEGAPPSFTEQMARQFGGVRGLIESSVPVLVFVVANVLASEFGWPLRVALIAAVGTAVVMAGYRLARRESVRSAVNGVFGIVVGAVMAWKTGSPKDFYLPGILIGFVYSMVLMVSVAVRRPLVGWMWSVVAGGGDMSWRTQSRLVRAFGWLTVLWAGFFLSKALLQIGVWYAPWITEAEKVSLLGVAKVALGVPPYLLLLGVTAGAARRIMR